MRNSLHFIGGALIALLLSFTFVNLHLYERLIIVLIVTAIAGIFWEIAREMLKKSFFDWNDVYRTILGGLILTLFL